MAQMTDETRGEIVRLARKGWTERQIWERLIGHPYGGNDPISSCTEEQVQQVIDGTDAIGRIAKWLDDAREAGYGSRDIAQMLVSAVGELTDAASDHELEGQDDDALADQLDALAEGTNEPLG